MNDYNEYFKAKTDDLYNMAKKVLEAGPWIDGIGMQSHMHAVDFGQSGSAHKNNDNKWNSYADTIDKFSSLGLDVQITELDVTNCASDNGKNLFVDIFKAAMERSDKISSLTLWGHCDAASWRRNDSDGGHPLPFDDNCQPKEFYNDIIALSGTVTPVSATIAATTAAATTQAATTTTTAAATTASNGGTVTVTKKGDVNCDGKVTVADAIMLARVVAEDKSVKVSDTGKANGEMDGVAGISSDDVTEILKVVAGIK